MSPAACAETEFRIRPIRAGVGRPHFGQRIDRAIERGAPAALPRGVMVFSLDFEQGVASLDDQAMYRRLKASVSGTRTAITGLLRLLERYSVPATWATVGHLFREPGPIDGIEVEPWVAAEMPAGHLFAPETIAEIAACRVPQDIGSHTYRHVNCAARELTDANIEDELLACARMAAARGLRLRSFVFPFNRVGRLELLARYGYTSFRGANSEWYTRGFSGNSRVVARLRSLLKLLDDLLALPPPVDLPMRVPAGLWNIPHSMLFKGADPRLPLGRQVRKAERGLGRAVRRKGVFHIWTHPENLGTRTAAALAALERIFQRADEYRQRGTLDILSMAQLAERLELERQGTTDDAC